MNKRKTTFRRTGWSLVSGALLLAGMIVSQTAQAVPGFARQTGMACLSCHFQNFPALNSFGRSFKANGYTMRGMQPLIEGDDLSLPSTLNMSMVSKIRYQLNENVDGGRGEIQWPDEAAFLVGGRASENVGFLMEIGLAGQEGEVEIDDANGDGIVNTDEVGAVPTNGNFLSAKYHFNVAENFSAIVFGTDALGVGYGFENLNTGMQRSQRPMEARKGMSAAQLLGLDGAATGVALVYATNDFFVNYSHFTPTYGNVNANIFGGLAHYLRAAYTPYIGGWDTGFGGAFWTGQVEEGATDPANEINVDAWVVDAQAQGAINDNVSLGVYGSYGVAPKSDSDVNQYNTSTNDDEKAWAIAAKLGVGKWRPYIGYASYDAAVGENVKDTTIGTSYMLAQNINLELFAVQSDKADADYTMISMFSAF